MVVVMLEVLRQVAISGTPFEHPIVFLWNGAEEKLATKAYLLHVLRNPFKVSAAWMP